MKRSGCNAGAGHKSIITEAAPEMKNCELFKFRFFTELIDPAIIFAKDRDSRTSFL